MIRWRYRRIVSFFARTLLSLLAWEIILPHLGMRKWSAATRPKRLHRAASQFRAMAIKMGGVLIKVGQFLSSRVDVLPPEITIDLSGLQDEVPAESFNDVRQVAEAEFGVPLEEKYFWFDESPLAAASLGQVHLAKLCISVPSNNLGSDQDNAEDPGIIQELVVKIQRPNIERIIATDLAALHTAGRWIQHYPAIRKRANVRALLDEFSSKLYEEIDYLAEGRNAETFAANFKDHPEVLVPKVVWTHTTRRVLTLENVQAIKITDYDAISAAGVSRAEVASRLLDTYLKQIFQDGFFHADPHPGNLFVTVTPTRHTLLNKPTEWQLTFVDFGMVGRLPANTRDGFRELLIGVGMRDASRIIKSYQMLGILLPGADLDLIEEAGDEIFDRFWGKNMTEMAQFSMTEMRDVTHQFRDLIYDMPFQVPQDIIFLGRAVGILSGMCTGIDPDFNVWFHLAPFAKQLVAEEVADHGGGWKEEITELAHKIYTFPGRVVSLMEKLEHGKLVVRDPELMREIKKLKIAINRMTTSIVTVPMIIASILLYLAGEMWLAGIFLLIAIIAWVWSFFQL